MPVVHWPLFGRSEHPSFEKIGARRIVATARPKPGTGQATRARLIRYPVC